MAPRSLPTATSASQLVSYSMCPRKYACHYVYGIEPEFTSTALIVGSVVHSGVEWWFGERLSGRSPTIDEALEIVAADFTATTADAHVRWRDQAPDSVEAQAQELLRTYLIEYGSLPVAAIEQPFEVPLEDPMDTGWVLPRPLRGYLDLVLDDHTVVELKTSSKAWPDGFLERHLQLGGYAYVWNALHGGPSKVQVHMIVKTRKPRIAVIPIERGESDTRWWFDAVAAIEEAIRGGHFPPSPGPLCVQCEYQQTCLHWDELQTEARPRRSLPVASGMSAHVFGL